MSIVSQLTQAIKNTPANMEQAWIAVSIAIAATAEKEYPQIKLDREKYETFLNDNRFLITMTAFRIGNPLLFGNVLKTVDKRYKDRDTITLSEILYYARCKLLHEAELPISVGFTDFTDGTMIDLRDPQRIVISNSLLYSLVLAVIAANSNAGNSFKENYSATILGKTIWLNKMWGKKQLLLDTLDIAKLQPAP
jgi:hypothetical protein